MADKKAAKLARRENKEARANEKEKRTGASPAQEAEAARRREDAGGDQGARGKGLDGEVGGDTATGRRGS